MFKRLFTAHPASVEETYGEHFRVAGRFGGRLLLAGLACLVHAALPFLFEKTGSNAIRELHRDMVTHRRGTPRPGDPAVSPGKAA